MVLSTEDATGGGSVIEDHSKPLLQLLLIFFVGAVAFLYNRFCYTMIASNFVTDCTLLDCRYGRPEVEYQRLATGPPECCCTTD